jgi:hypothetical protein
LCFIISKTTLTNPRSLRLTSVFTSKNFIILALKFVSLTH